MLAGLLQIVALCATNIYAPYIVIDSLRVTKYVFTGVHERCGALIAVHRAERYADEGAHLSNRPSSKGPPEIKPLQHRARVSTTPVTKTTSTHHLNTHESSLRRSPADAATIICPATDCVRRRPTCGRLSLCLVSQRAGVLMVGGHEQMAPWRDSDLHGQNEQSAQSRKSTITYLAANRKTNQPRSMSLCADTPNATHPRQVNLKSACEFSCCKGIG